MRTGIFAIFQELHPISIVFTFAIAILLNSILTNDSLTLINKRALNEHGEGSEPNEG